jgi:hypothetical protein
MRAPQEGVNEKGYWEHLGLLEVHERLLDHLGSCWDDVRPLPQDWWKASDLASFRDEIRKIVHRDFAGSPVWGVKDPRMCRLAPLWVDVLRELGCKFAFILIYRHPLEVARSLEKRDGFLREKSIRLWVENNLAAEKGTQGFRRVFVAFDDLLSHPTAVITQIQTITGVGFPKRSQEAQDALHDFLAPQLRHHHAPRNSSDLPPEGCIAEKILEALRESSYEERNETEMRWDELHRRYQEIVSSTEPAITGHIADLHGRVRELRETLDRLQSSPSWQVTRPLRKFGSLVSRVLS